MQASVRGGRERATIAPESIRVAVKRVALALLLDDIAAQDEGRV